MEILIRPNANEVAVLAADILAGYAKKGATLGLATGSTPVATYAELIRRFKEDDLSFAQCRAFLLDEYVEFDRAHEQSYYSTIRREFTSHIDIPDELVKSPGSDDDSARPDEAAAAYERAIVEAGGIDIQLLGIGSNGHIGFNEPSSSLSSLTRVKTLHPQTVRDNSRFFDSADNVPLHVLTQGLGTISRAGHLLLLATGEGKAEAIRAAVEGPVSAMCPASILQWHRHATVIVDEAAASLLVNREYYQFTDSHKPDWQAY